MATDERQEEQLFLAELKARSGRDLADWMAAIAAQNFGDKNDTIDWLRQQGFAFARASWLERIHSNGGRPIYEELPERAARPAARPKPPQATAKPPQATAKSSEATAKPSEATAKSSEATAKPPEATAKPPGPPSPPAAEEAEFLDKLIAGAKGYRPLYLLLEAELRARLPGLVLRPATTHIAFSAPQEFAAVSLHASEVRLGLALGDRPFDARVQRAKLKGVGSHITHMLVLTDARQVNADLISLVMAANASRNG